MCWLFRMRLTPAKRCCASYGFIQVWRISKPESALLLKQSASAATSLNEQAAQLTQVVSVFRLKGNGSAEKTSPRPLPQSRHSSQCTTSQSILSCPGSRWRLGQFLNV